MNYQSLAPAYNGYHTLETADQSQKVKVTDVLLMYFLLMISGNPFFNLYYDQIVAASIVVPCYYVLTNSYKKVTFSTVFIFTFLLGYELMHALVYSLDYSLTIFKLFLVLILAFASAQILGDRFVKTMTVTMVIIIWISFIFTALCYVPGINVKLYTLAEQMFPIPRGFKDYSTPTFLIYTFHPQYFLGEFDYVRNAGIFWESGAFAVFLNLNLYLRYISKRIVKVRDLFDKTSILFMVALVTTTSTMGLLGLMVILTFFTMKLRSPIKFVFLILMTALSYLAFVNVEFLGDKIATQLEESDERNNRFGAFLMDWQDIKERPIIGSSRRIEVLFGTNEHSKKTRRPNGFSNFLREYGLIYFTAYFMMCFYSFRRIYQHHHQYTKFSYAFFGVVLLWILSFSEIIFDLPFFKSLIFVGMGYLTSQYRESDQTMLETEEEAVETV